MYKNTKYTIKKFITTGDVKMKKNSLIETINVKKDR